MDHCPQGFDIPAYLGEMSELTREMSWKEYNIRIARSAQPSRKDAKSRSVYGIAGSYRIIGKSTHRFDRSSVGALIPGMLCALFFLLMYLFGSGLHSRLIVPDFVVDRFHDRFQFIHLLLNRFFVFAHIFQSYIQGGITLKAPLHVGFDLLGEGISPSQGRYLHTD